MEPSGNQSGKQQTAEAHAAHESPEQYAQRHSRGPDNELKQLEPDNFVDQRGAAASDKHNEEQGKNPARTNICHFVCGNFIQTHFTHVKELLGWTVDRITKEPGGS